MRYAIVSDIHGNIHAWNAAYQDILNVGVDEIVCLGDLVGYGPEPGRVIESCYANIHHFVLGNHDAAVCGKLKMRRFNADSRQILEWTAEQLNRSGIRFLSDMPLVVNGQNAIFAHSSVVDPQKFDYLYQPQDCLPSWGACEEQAIFIGHTHISGIHMIGEMGIPQWLPSQDLRFTRDIRYVINVGSVGQPRDGDTRACYLIYDTDRQSIQYRRVPYNLGDYFNDLRELGLPVHPCMIEGSAAQAETPGGVSGYQNMEMPRVMGAGGKVKPLGAVMVEEGAAPILSKTKFKSRRVAASSGRHSATTGRHSATTGRHSATTGRNASTRGARLSSRGSGMSGEYHRDAVSRSGAYRAPVRRSRGGGSTIIAVLFGAILLVGVLGALLIIANTISQPREQAYQRPILRQRPPQRRPPITVTRQTIVKKKPPKIIANPRPRVKQPGPAKLGETGSGGASGFVAGTRLLLGDADKDGEEPAEW